MRKLLNRKVTEQGGKCAICHKEFAEYSDIVPDHKHPKGMGGAWRDDHPDNIQAFKPHIGGATLKRDRAGLTTDDPMTSGHSTSEPHECWIEQGAVRNACGEMLRLAYYVDSNSVAHGFLRSREGNYTTFGVPGAGAGAGQGTFPYSINPAVTITGQYIDASNVIHGFIRTAEGSITKFDAPGAGTGAGQGTFPDGLNIEGVIIGMSTDANNAVHGFLRTPW